MDKFKNIRNRLSLSVDKLSPPRSKSPVNDRNRHESPPDSFSRKNFIASEFTTPKRPRRVCGRSSQRPKSTAVSSETGHYRTFSMENEAATESKLAKPKENTIEDDSGDQSFDSLSGFASAIAPNESESLMDEVMKEVQRISNITDNIVKNRDSDSDTKYLQETLNGKFVHRASDDTLHINTTSSSSSSIAQDKMHSSKYFDQSSTENRCTTLSTESTLHSESLTSGYISDSVPEDIGITESKRLARAKTASPLQRIFKISKQDKMEKEGRVKTGVHTENTEKSDGKKESIYSRLIKSTKSESSTPRSPKEPIYARIKPKLKAETSFKPIEPIVPRKPVHDEPEFIMKPEPTYTKAELKELDQQTEQESIGCFPVSLSRGKNASSFKPVSPVPLEKELSEEPIYSSIKPKKEKTRTLPLEAIYSKIKRKDAHTLPKETTPPCSSSISSSAPIYNQPLPAIPVETSNLTTNRNDVSCSSGSESSCGKIITVKTKEIIPTSPSKPSVITICNPGYAKTCSPSLSTSVKTPPTSPVASVRTVSSPKNLSESKSTGIMLDIEDAGDSTEDMNLSPTAQGIGEEIKMNLGSSSKLNQLVEELAQELENVSKRTGNSKSGESSKKEVISRILSTYDVPKNLRRVEEADEEDVRKAENCLLMPSFDSDELRFMDDDDNMETVYADVPDYSQDEFVIALDDENDPKYATLTRDMRRKSRGGDSPGRVSRKSAQVYVNVVNVISALKVLINSNSNKAATVINKMGTLARPYAHKVHSSLSENNAWIQRRLFHKSGHNGFDELRKYIKSGGEFCKELAIIMHERAELEATYAKGLHKLSSKLVKASRDSIGTVSEAWQAVGAELEHEGDVHRILAASLTEEVVRPLRQVIETQHKIRKGIEGLVDKTTKNLHDWRAAELKTKKNCYHNARENEKVQDMVLEARLGRKSLSEKDTIKLEKQRKKSEEALQKSDVEYYNFCIRTERARQEWESAVYKGSNCFQTLEEERLASLKDLVGKYHQTNKEAAPKLVSCAARLDEPVEACDVSKDIQAVIAAKGTCENIPEQYLPDFYSEDFKNAMNKARRKETLEKFIKMIRTDLERERRGKQGVENLAKALQETPNFGGEESQQDVNDKLQNMKAMLAYLEATRYKVESCLHELSNRPRGTHPLAKHIETHRDKQGIPISVLKIPPWVRGNNIDVALINETSPDGSPNWNERGTADGNSCQPDSDFVSDPHPEATSGPPTVFLSPVRYPSLTLPTDEFSSHCSDADYQNGLGGVATGPFRGSPDPFSAQTSSKSMHPEELVPHPSDGTYYARPLTAGGALGRCKALYDYDANMYDELSIRTGDIISIHEKQPDGWWVGEVSDVIGIFPATYVQEID